MDKLQWFKFSYADWRMGKIQRCSEITQARFVNLCCLYWNKEANISIEDAEIEIDKEHLDILIGKKIIEVDNQHIFIKFLDEQLKDIAETSKGKSKAAKARWEKYKKDNADAMQNDAEKRREEKRRKDEIEIELNNSQTWKEGLAKLNTCNLIEVEKHLVIFLEGQELDDNLDRDLTEIKKHFRAWLSKQDLRTSQQKRTIAL